MKGDKRDWAEKVEETKTENMKNDGTDRPVKNPKKTESGRDEVDLTEEGSEDAVEEGQTVMEKEIQSVKENKEKEGDKANVAGVVEDVSGKRTLRTDETEEPMRVKEEKAKSKSGRVK